MRRRWLPNRDRSRVLRALDRRRVLQGESRRYDVIDIVLFGWSLVSSV